MSPDRPFTRARLGIAATFGLAGALCAVWTVRVPALKDKLHVDKGQLGLVVLAFGIGGVISMILMGRLGDRLGSRRLLTWSVPLSTLTAAGIGLAPDLGGVIAVAFAFGLVFGVTDVAMNTQASQLEHRYGRPLMAGMHAGWSIGAVSGGLLGALAAHLGIGFTASVVGASVLCLPLAVVLRTTYLPDPEPAPAHHGDGAAPARPRIPAAVWVLGFICFCSFMVEGAIADWSGLYLRDTLGSTEALAALGYPMFELATATGRLTGDRFTSRFGARRFLTFAGVATAAGLVVVLAAGVPAVGIAGFFLTGLAVAIVVPLTISVAGALGGPDSAGASRAIARVGVVGYTGLLVGPVGIGFAADATSLRAALGSVVVLALLVTVAARTLPRDRRLTPGEGTQHPAHPTAAPAAENTTQHAAR